MPGIWKPGGRLTVLVMAFLVVKYLSLHETDGPKGMPCWHGLPGPAWHQVLVSG